MQQKCGFQSPGLGTTAGNKRVGLQLWDNPIDLCLTPQFSYYFEFMRKQDDERIKETFIYKSLEIIIILVRIAV